MVSTALINLFKTHTRSFEDNRFVYAVVSRRSSGVSIGVNLNPDKYSQLRLRLLPGRPHVARRDRAPQARPAAVAR